LPVSPQSALSPTARRVLAAYGGADRWRDASGAEGCVTLSGLLFYAKWRHLPPRSLITIDLTRPLARMQPIDRQGHVGVLDGLDVRLEDTSGRLLAGRKEAHRFFPGGRRTLFWDRLDLAYFVGYAFWGYSALPRLLLRDDIEWREIEDGVLEARFGPNLPRHSEIQRFSFDRRGLLTRNDYVAEVVSPKARATNRVLAHGEWEGIPYPSLRRVTARIADEKVTRWPTLVGIRVTDWRLL
jgi:hypothetical protein